MRGSITKHPTGWRLQAYLGRHPHTSKDVRRTRIVHAPHTRAGRKEAERELARWVLELDGEPIVRPTGTPTVSEMLDRWVAAREPSWSPKTAHDNRMWIRTKIVPRLGDWRIDTIRAADLDRLYAELLTTGSKKGKPLAPRSVKRAHTILHAAFEQAIKWGEIATNPAKLATPPQLGRTSVTPPPPEAVAAALTSTDDPMWQALLRLAVTTGARRSQILGLRWSDLDLDDQTATYRSGVVATAGVVHVKGTKTDSPYTVALDDDCGAALRRWRAKAVEVALGLGVKPDADGFVFTSQPDASQPLHPDSVKTWWNRLRARTPELDGVRFHDLRHFVATQLLAAGVDVRTVAGRLGHANPSVTLSVYGHFMPAADRHAADVIAQIVG